MILSAGLDCRPYAEAPDERIPVAHLHLAGDHWITGLDPDALTEVAELLHAQDVHLETEVRPRLAAARADWARQHAHR